MGNINFEKCPLCPRQFDILEIEGKKKEKLSKRARPRARPQLFGEVDESKGVESKGSSVFMQ